MKKSEHKMDVIDFFKKEILTTRVLVDNIRKEFWKESITISNLSGQNKFKSGTKKKLTRRSLCPAKFESLGLDVSP